LGDPNAGEVAEHHWRRMLREAMRENARTRLAERLEQVTELPVGAWRDQWAEQRMALRQSYQRAREASNVRPSQR
jgi:hypothetical protein